MAAHVVRTGRQRELEKLYNRMCGKRSRYEVWQDAMWLIACSISNAVDKRHFEQREAHYKRIVQKYEEKELDAFPDFFAHIILGMEDDHDCDFLGELYMRLYLGNCHLGQFFTPYHICELMARITIDDSLLRSQIDRCGYVSINDCACGAGATLIAAANCLQKSGINYQRHALFIAQDIDATVALMCYIQLSLMGCAGYVKVGNSLTEPITGNALFGDGKETTWYTPMYFAEPWSTLRAMNRMKYVMDAVATVCPSTADVKAGKTIPKNGDAGKADSAPLSADEDAPMYIVGKNGQVALAI